MAKSLRVPNDKLWQAVVAIWQANKEQFQGGNLHGLPVGAFLVIPSDLTETMALIRLSEAQEIVAGQWEEWRTLQSSGLNKQRITVAAPTTDAPATEATPRDLAATAAVQPEGTMPTEQTADQPVPGQAVVFPVDKTGAMVNMAELQTVLQGLEERLLRRLTPLGQSELQEAKLPTALVSAAELQASIQSLEERLTQRMQHMLLQTSEPVRVGQRPLQPILASVPAPPPPAQPVSLLLVPYVLVFTNALLLLLVGALIWLWLRRRDRVERMQRV
jgi:hypothetical protein